MKIASPTIELLAIKLYEHDHSDKGWPPARITNWMALDDEDRNLYREIAGGKSPLDVE